MVIIHFFLLFFILRGAAASNGSIGIFHDLQQLCKIFISRGPVILNSHAMQYCNHSPPALFIFQNITLPVIVCVYECIYICMHFTYVYQRVCVCVCITKFIT